MAKVYQVEHLHQPDGWLSPGYITIAVNGLIESVSALPPTGEECIEKISGFGVPGLPNLHSHAFQRALAGRTECISKAVEDTFWTWRTFMYDFVSRLEPHHYEAISAFVYLEMIKYGMTSVAEFHYVHHAPNGARYDNHAEMSDRLIAAAGTAGIGMTILPVLYAHAGIGQPPGPQQKRFVHNQVDDYLDLVSLLQVRSQNQLNLEVGLALHSLRAVSAEEARHAVAGALDMDPNCRLHIHVSEQPLEVEEVEAGLGARPVQWLLDNIGLDDRWSLIHATHLDEQERKGLAASGAVAGLCPMTEATLGDGVFPLVEYQLEGGRWGIGTDSNYTTSAAAELRMLECGLRLQAGRRNMLVSSDSDITSRSGRRLFDLALAGGAQSLGMPVGSLTAGQRADVVILNSNSPSIISHTTETVIDAWILSATTNPVRDVMVGGNWVLRDGKHELEEEIIGNYKNIMNKLISV